ncbi:hypothetical protein BCV70DRAFT_113060 [Testicularia cyperi]|uniref:Uncharacterized protein n=1 Tax=Testicularia cyperi TaxID=1882483 RepID=A0A317XR17_9BASI|nr:hypothetical protein BCV70DRAFT_113060 [Testicularia cyperi]
MTMVSRLILVALVAQLASLASLAGECMGAKSGSLRERDPTRDSAFGLAKRDDAPTYHELSGTWVSGKANAGTSGTASGGGGGGGGGRRENGGWNGGNSGIFTGGLTPGSIAGPKTDKDPVPHFIYPIRSDDSIWASWCQGGPKPRYACFHRAYGEYYEYYIDLKYDPYTVFSWGKNCRFTFPRFPLLTEALR